MKKILLFVNILMSIAATAQDAYQVSGVLLDEKKEALPFVNILLLKQKDSSLVKAAISEIDGSFKFEAIKNGNYILSASMVGYIKQMLPIAVNNANYNTDKIEMKVEANQLKEVTVTAKKPFIEMRGDKLIVNVANSSLTAGNNALEAIAKAPGVILNQQSETLSFRGKSVTIYIDNRKVNIEPSELLKTIQSSEIESIELIANPSSRYDADGQGGIINIKTKKALNYGLNGTATLGFGQGQRDKYNASVNLNARKEKFNWYATYSGSLRNNVTDAVLTSNFSNETINDVTSKELSQSLTQSVKGGIDWLPNKKNTIGAIISYAFAQKDADTDATTNIFDGNLNGKSKLTNQTNEDRSSDRISTNLNYRRTFDKKGKEFITDLDYTYYNRAISTNLINISRTPPNIEIGVPFLLRNSLPTQLNIFAGKTDYILPISDKTGIEMGAKISRVRSENDAIFELNKNGNWENDPTRTNNFVYQEGIEAGYVQMNHRLKKSDFQIGLRLEHTNAVGTSRTINQSYKRDYTQLFPSVNFNQQIGKNNTFSLSYSRRIDRPVYQELNPFIYFIDLYTYKQGNPNLKPQLTNAYQASFVLMDAFMIALGYNRTNDYMIPITEKVSNTTNVSRIYTTNLGLGETYSLDLSVPLPIAKWWEIYNNIGFYKMKYTSTDINIDNGQFFWQINSQSSIKLPKNWSFELSGNYRSGGVYGVMNLKPLYRIDLGLQKSLFEKKATLRFSYNDILYSDYQRFTSFYQGLSQAGYERFDSRVFKVNFTYKFGNAKVKNIKKRSTVSETEQGRIKSIE